MDAGIVFSVYLASLVYLSLDFFVALRHFESLRTVSFWVLWVVVGTANVLSFYWLAGSGFDGLKFGPARLLATIFFSTVGSAAILQSMTFSLGDSQVLDVSRFVKSLRAAVLADEARNKSKRDMRRAMLASRELSIEYPQNVEALRDAWTSARSHEGVTIERIAGDLSQMDEDAERLGIPVVLRIAQRLAQAHPDHARELVDSARIAKQRALRP